MVAERTDEAPTLAAVRLKTPWKADVLKEAQRQRVELRRAYDDIPELLRVHPEEEPTVQASITSAQNAALHPAAPLTNWLFGTDIERAWAALKTGGRSLLRMYPFPRLLSRAEELLNEGTQTLGVTHPAVARLAAALKSVQPAEGALNLPSPEVQDAIREGTVELKEAIDFDSDASHARVRSFRNVLILVTAVEAILLIGVGLDPPAQPFLPICSGAAGCAAVWQVELAGALGGLLAGVLALRSLAGYRGPYGLPVVQAVLKVPTGALTGLLGATFVQTGVIGAFMPQPGLKILAYAAIFGYAQEAFTAFVDRQAKNIMGGGTK